jgi:phosphoenolpyruvate synthase/pyruvate phosphate dikinase
VIPFGAFRAFVDRPLKPGGPSVFEWMKSEYAKIATLPRGSEARGRRVSTVLKTLRKWIVTTDPGPDFRAQLREALDANLGTKAESGVFVRSDTNVEDLAGFTGAGLNLTVPNVVGFERIVAAVQQVWSSPFTERAYSWRQAHMEEPEYVFPAVVVQRSFPSEKSGVMVTTDLVSRKPGWITVAINEGVGGVVDGQAAETLRINLATGAVQQLAKATTPYRRVLTDDGGLKTIRASGTDALLDEDEVDQLIDLAREVDSHFPGLVRADGSRAPGDVEFAFHDGRLALLQIRPFVDSDRARSDYYLAALDAGLAERRKVPVPLDEIPEAVD